MDRILLAELTDFLYDRWIDTDTRVEQMLSLLDELKLTEKHTLKEEAELITVLDQMREEIFLCGLMAKSQAGETDEISVNEELCAAFLRLIPLQADAELTRRIEQQGRSAKQEVYAEGQKLRSELAAFFQF